MDPEKIACWQAADAAFDRWLDLRGKERDAWLAAVALPDPVRRRLLQLIAAHLQPNAALDPVDGNLAGHRLGGWTLDTELGRGGMAVVYRAWREQGMARQYAAIKVLTLGALGAAGRARFQREAEILARLNHPGITSLIDSGVSGDGTCWLAMPLVDGERIDRWCETQALDARATVRLYLQVCAAVAWAHRNLVIHRDLKPSNVLVDGEGHVRLLDFGISQFADAEDERTQTLWRALTPGYAAPEQLRGAPPSTAVDVYGLGALLHRLLTGRTPQAGNGHADTTPPSWLVISARDACHRHYVPLRNDLDRVLLKALAEEPERRYATADALADDLRRWLDGRPVLAQKPGTGYRLRKFVMRNKLGVAAAAVLAASLVAGVGATLWQADIAHRHAVAAQAQAAHAEREEGKARQRAHRAEAVRDFLGTTFITTRAGDGGAARVGDVMAAAAAGARSGPLAEDPLAAADILLLTGTVRFNLDDYQRSREDLEQALELLAPHTDAAAGEIARAHWELGRHAKRRGDAAAMLAHHRQAVEWNQRWDAPLNESLRARISLAEALLQSDRKAAEAMFRTLVAEIQSSALKDSVRHINALNGLSIALAGPGQDPRRRLPIQQERVRIARRLYGADGGGLAFTLADVTHTYRDLGLLDQAEALAREAVAISDRSLQRPLMLRAMSRCNLGLVLQQGGRHAEALDALRHSDTLLRELDDRGPATVRCLLALAYAEATAARPAQAAAVLDRNDALLAAQKRTRNPDALAGCGLRASVELRRGRHDAASRALSACPAPEDAGKAPLAYRQARAEWLFAGGDGAASALLAQLRAQHAPADNQREWMRPWMLSVLLAHDGADAAMSTALRAELGRFADVAPLSHCLARPDRTSCLALP